MSFKRFVSVALCVGISLAAFASTANASLMLTLSDETATMFTVLDGGVGDNDGVVNGVINFSNTVPTKILSGFTTLTIISVSNAPGSPVSADLNTTNIQFMTTAAKTVSLLVSDVFSLPGSAGSYLTLTNGLTENFNFGSASSTQVTKLDGTPTPVASTSASGSMIQVIADETMLSPVLRAGPTFLMETSATTIAAAGTFVSFTHSSKATAYVPEPAALLVWSLILSLSVGVTARRSR